MYELQKYAKFTKFVQISDWQVLHTSSDKNFIKTKFDELVEEQNKAAQAIGNNYEKGYYRVIEILYDSSK